VYSGHLFSSIFRTPVVICRRANPYPYNYLRLAYIHTRFAGILQEAALRREEVALFSADAGFTGCDVSYTPEKTFFSSLYPEYL